jgi:hypothetical protein
LPDTRAQIRNRPSREGSGERRAPTTVSVAVGGQHAVLECIKQRAFGDTMHLREGRLGRAEDAVILAQPLDVGMAEDEVATRLMCNEGMGRAVEAENAVRICLELLILENR